METPANPLVTPGPIFMDLLRKAGHSGRKLDGLEKLDLLLLISDQVMYNITHGRRMQLTIKDLDELLVREGASSAGDAKAVAQGLLELRRRQRARIASYVVERRDEAGQTAEAADAAYEQFSMALVAMPEQRVYDCFAPSAAATPQRKRSRDVETEAAATAPPPTKTMRVDTDASASGKADEKDPGDGVTALATVLHPELKQLLMDYNPGEKMLRLASMCSGSDLGPTDETSSGSELGPIVLAPEPTDQERRMETTSSGSGLGLIVSAPEADGQEKERMDAEMEVERIIALRGTSEILGSGSIAEMEEEFRRLVKVVHPDKGVVSGERAEMAVRIAVAALKKLRREVQAAVQGSTA